MVLWKYRSFWLSSSTSTIFNEVETFLNELSAEGYNQVTIENFPDRTTVYATKEEENKEDEHKEEDMVRYSGIIRKHG